MKVSITPIYEPTEPFTVQTLYGAIDDLIVELGRVDVAGTVTSWRATKNGWARAEIASLDPNGNALGKLSIGIPPATRYPGGPVSVGADVVVGGWLETHPLYTPLQLRADEVTLIASVAAPVNELRDYIARLEASGHLRANGTRFVPDPISRVGLVIPASGGAGLNDPMSILEGSALPLRVERHPVAMMGTESARAIADAIGRAAASNEVVLLCRGGGATADLAAFNSIEVTEAIVTSPTPVITGIGHAHDTTAADLVAHTRTETPTAAAGWVLASNRRSQDLADQAALVAQQQQAAQVAQQGQRELAHAAEVKTTADRRVRIALIAVAVLVALMVMLVVAGLVLAG